MVTKQGDIYYLGARGYPYTEVIGDQVAASTNLENNLQWVITYREGQGAYTIQAVNHEGKGWTVAGESIVIQHLTGEPGGGRELSRRQLFKFDRM
ncbi:hypothetical protein OG21DRAFT_1517365 [Imleria badia]|nr:hypothetical protein OG21DRAFT_1517365 [Imleria badia]